MTKKENIKKGSIIHGWRVKRIKKVNPEKQIFIELQHIETGAKYIHLANTDKNNVFCAGFKTIPKDSTGIAHILEHTALTGSKKYPLRDPFFSMYKRSLKTFMNAFTSGDWTAYPFATKNRKDFMNLLSVYLDACFNPVLSEENFRQEGWRYDFEEDSLVYKGVVYNEMKGSMSSADRIMSEAQRQALFKKSPYKYNSGGRPEEIVKLKHYDLIGFHKQYYHPSNAFFFSYGNFPLPDTLVFVNENAMAGYGKKRIRSNIPSEPRQKKPGKFREYYEIGPKENIGKKHQSAVVWLLCDITDSFTVLSLEILEDILIGNQASPLRKKLIESGLGSDLSDESGFNTEFKETFFSIGLKDLKEKQTGKVGEIVFESLKELAEKGIDKELIESSLHKLIISKKEISNNPYPHGIGLWLDFFAPWIHGGDPLETIDINKNLKAIKLKIRKGKFFEKLIKDYFLKNKHYVFLNLVPKKNMFSQKEKEINRSLERKEKAMSPRLKARIRKQAEKLLLLQKKEENASILPGLKIKDIDPGMKKTKKRKFNNFALYEKKTGGIIYVNLVYGLGGLETRQLPYVPFFCFAINKAGTKNKDSAKIIRELEKYTGGINFRPIAAESKGKKESLRLFVSVEAKCLEENGLKCLELMRELIRENDFSDTRVLPHFLKEKKSRLENAILENGHFFASSMAAAGISRKNYIDELWGGTTHLLWLDKMSGSKGEKIRYLKNDLEDIAGRIFSRSAFKASITGNKRTLGRMAAELKTNFKGKKADNGIFNKKIGNKNNKKKAMAFPSQVAYTAGVRKAVKINHDKAAALLVLSKMLSMDYLHREIREKGGAYGGYLRYDYLSGLLIFLSYRDPNIKRTLDIYRKSLAYVNKQEVSQEVVNESVLQAISEIDKPLSPAEEAYNDFFLDLLGIGFEQRKKFKKSILSVSPRQIKSAAAEFLPEKMSDLYIGIIASEEKIRKSKVIHLSTEKRGLKNP